MKKLLALAAALVVPSTAHAGLGATAGTYTISDGTSWVPSIDFRQSGFLVQAQLLDLIGGLPNDAVNIGLGVSYLALKRQVAPEVEGVVMPGARVRFVSANNASAWHGLAEARVGMEMKKGAGFGVYVVPMLGAGDIAGGNVALTYGGGLEVSAWFIGK